MKAKMTIILFLVMIYGLSIMNLLIKDQELSLEERRHLKQLPQLSISNIVDGSIMDDFETYTLDQFPFRNLFRMIKANTEYHVFQKLDNNQIFIKDDKIFKMEYILDEKSVIQFTDKIKKIKEILPNQTNVYYAIIPDKNYYLNDEHLKMDYDQLYDIVNHRLSDLKYIEIRDLLSLDHYYNTDTHWRQEKLLSIAKHFEYIMTGKTTSHQYQKVTYEPFYGVYFGQAAVGKKADILAYLTNETIENANVENKIDSSFHQVYKTQELGKMDSYNVFLSGSTPFITIENPNNKTGKELIIFRDSFASSLAPLLIDSYSKITLLDLRYMPISKISEEIKFEQQDILFLYSTMMINQSMILKD